VGGLVATVRPDSWNFPLFLHILGAMVLVGGLLASTGLLWFSRGDPRFLRLGYYSLLAVALPGWALMFGGAEWIYRREGLADEPFESAWVLIGFLVAEVGGVLLLVSLAVGGIGLRRHRTRRSTALLTATTWLSAVLLAANLLAVWAMAGKPD